MNQYRTQVRFPSQSLVDEIKELAKSQQRSMNTQIIRLIQKGLESEKKQVA